MAFVQTINPFTGILCVPFYHIWIVIIISWILSWIEIIFLHFIHKRDKQVWQKLQDFDHMDNKVDSTIREQIELILEEISIEHEKLSYDVISIILSMLPRGNSDKRWWSLSLGQQFIDSMYWRSKLLQYMQFVYPIIRFTANLINLIIVLIRYGYWYDDHDELSDWNKYCAFIITFFYIPNFKGRAISNIWWLESMENETTEWLSYANIFIEMAFFVWFIIISFPVFISGIFIYLTTTIIALIWILSIYFGLHKLGKLCDKEDCGEIIGVVVSFTVVVMWLFVVIIMSTIEFYETHSWIKSLEIGFLGKYCHENDYFQINKWNKYPIDIQFLIISWILF